MAKGGGSAGRGPSKGKASRGSNLRPKPAAKPTGKAAGKTRKPAPKAPPPEVAVVPPAEFFRLGAVPGATPGKWMDAWRERMPVTTIELEPIEVRDQRSRLADGDLDAALVRLPIDTRGLHVIPLYEEVAVVVMSAESSLTVGEEIEFSDLVGEVVITPLDDVYGLEVPGVVAPGFAPPADTAEAIETVAAGVGVVIVPMSLARLHQRKDVEYRILRGGPASTVALAWPEERTTPEVEAFVGIVRGRTANSSRV